MSHKRLNGVGLPLQLQLHTVTLITDPAVQAILGDQSVDEGPKPDTLDDADHDQPDTLQFILPSRLLPPGLPWPPWLLPPFSSFPPAAPG